MFALLLAELAGHPGQRAGHLHLTGWLLSTLGICTSTNFGPTLFILFCYSPALPGHVSTLSTTSGKAGHQGNPLLYPGFLQLDLPCPQEVRRLETRYRPQRPQQVSMLSTLTDGDDGLHHALTSTRLLGNLPGLQGCFLPHPSRACSPTLPQLPVQPPLLPIPGPSVRSGHITVPLHSPSQDSRHLRQGPGAFPYSSTWTTGTSQPPRPLPAWPGPHGFSTYPSSLA